MAAEFFGTGLLLATIVGSGIMASRLTADTALQLLACSIATGATLVALITVLQSVSADFNPAVTLVAALKHQTAWRDVAPLVGVQVVGGIVGVVTANVMFEVGAVSWSTQVRTGSGLWVAEVVATAGLVFVIFGTLRAGRRDGLALAVGAYIVAAYWFTASTSFANPAVTTARMFSDTFAGIAPASAPAFLAAQIVGALVAFVALHLVFSTNRHLCTTHEDRIEA